MIRKTVKTTRTEPIRHNEAVYVFEIVIRDVLHFKTIVRWMNNNVGMGRHNWSMGGKQVLNRVKAGKNPKITIYIMNNKCDELDISYLSIL